MSSRKLVRQSSISSEARSLKSSQTELVVSSIAAISVSLSEIHSRRSVVSTSAPLKRSCSTFCTALKSDSISFANVRCLSVSVSSACSCFRQRLRIVLKESVAT